jgi:serine beta-lactamase-like protein LACTB, mitochondrial
MLFKNRIETWLVLIVIAVGAVLAFVAGLFVYVKATSTPLHPDPKKVPSATRSAPVPKWADAIERGRQLARTGLTDQNLPGLSVAVGVGGDVVWAEGFGWADLEKRVGVTPDTRFRIGSASKALTSAAAGLLLEKGRLKLDDEIQTYVPAFPKKQWPVTVRQLMGHMAGIRQDGGGEEDVFTHCQRPVDGMQRFAGEPLRFEPGTQYRYSNYGWILVSAAIETAAAEPFSRFMRAQIFDPLDMHDTKPDDTTEANRANQYFPRFAANPLYGPQEPDELDFSCFSGSSGFLSTPSDLVRFVMAVNSGKLLQPATVQLLQTSQRLTSGQETGYGLGWDLETVTLAGKPTQVVGYDGELRGGMVASFLTYPERGIVVAVTSNTSFADTASVASRIAEAFAATK